MTTPMTHIYLAGGVDSAPDLGVGWRKEADKLIRATKGPFVAMYPSLGLEQAALEPDLTDKVKKHWATCVEHFNLRHQLKHPLEFPLNRLLGCRKVLFYWNEHALRGTQAEFAVSIAMGAGMDIVVCMPDQRHFPSYNSMAFGLGLNAVPIVYTLERAIDTCVASPPNSRISSASRPLPGLAQTQPPPVRGAGDHHP